MIKAENAKTPIHEVVLELGNTPECLLNHCSFPELPLLIKAKIIVKAHFEHGVPIIFLKKLPEILTNPKFVFKSANAAQVDSVVVFTFEVQRGFPIIVPIRQNQLIGWDKYFNLVTSIYPKEGSNPIAQWTKKGLLLWESPYGD